MGKLLTTIKNWRRCWMKFALSETSEHVGEKASHQIIYRSKSFCGNKWLRKGLTNYRTPHNDCSFGNLSLSRFQLIQRSPHIWCINMTLGKRVWEQVMVMTSKALSHRNWGGKPLPPYTHLKANSKERKNDHDKAEMDLGQRLSRLVCDFAKHPELGSPREWAKKACLLADPSTEASKYSISKCERVQAGQTSGLSMTNNGGIDDL